MSAVAETVLPAVQPAPSFPVTVTPKNPMDVLALLIQRGADMAVIREMMTLQKEWEAHQALKAFDAAISAAKAEIKPIMKNREVDFTNRNGGGRTNYMYEDFAQIADHVDPILARHGLSYRHRPKQEGKMLTITCILSHRDGHREETPLTAANDDSGNKNGIQAIGSTATFLQRYTIKLALGLAAAKDDDGRAASADEPPAPEAPKGYEDWRADMSALADEGLAKLTETWSKSNPDFRRHVIKHDEQWWSDTKAKAVHVDKKRLAQ